MNLRIFAAIVCVGVAAVGALVLHDHREAYTRAACRAPGGWNFPCAGSRRPGWADPAALGVLFVGLAVGAAVARRT